jgi:pimeloyl-ACP methyl ester carboxylesterase
MWSGRFREPLDRTFTLLAQRGGLLARVSAVTMALLVPTATAAARGEPPFHFDFTEKAGKYSVGFKVFHQQDLSRPSLEQGSADHEPETHAQGRSIQILEWYPAIRPTANPMELAGYEALARPETPPSQFVPSEKQQKFVETYMQGTETQSTWSTRDAVTHPGRFPVIIYAPSLNAPAFENIELCEYLATYGFVVLASPSMGASSRTMTVDFAGASAQARDISFLINFAKTLPDSNLSALALIGYSWGSTAILIEAAKDPRVRALVALDGSFRYSTDPSLYVDNPDIPLLFFSRGETPLANAALSDPKALAEASVLRNWKGDLLQVRLLAISHIQFSSLFQRSDRFRHEGTQFVPVGYSLQDGEESYNWMARYTLEFLETYLLRDHDAHTFLMRSPVENGIPSRLIAKEYRPALHSSSIPIHK